MYFQSNKFRTAKVFNVLVIKILYGIVILSRCIGVLIWMSGLENHDSHSELIHVLMLDDATPTVDLGTFAIKSYPENLPCTAV